MAAAVAAAAAAATAATGGSNVIVDWQRRRQRLRRGRRRRGRSGRSQQRTAGGGGSGSGRGYCALSMNSAMWKTSPRSVAHRGPKTARRLTCPPAVANIQMSRWWCGAAEEGEEMRQVEGSAKKWVASWAVHPPAWSSFGASARHRCSCSLPVGGARSNLLTPSSSQKLKASPHPASPRSWE